MNILQIATVATVMQLLLSKLKWNLRSALMRRWQFR
jgi:hypothetical protein